MKDEQATLYYSSKFELTTTFSKTATAIQPTVQMLLAYYKFLDTRSAALSDFILQLARQRGIAIQQFKTDEYKFLIQ